MSINNKRTLLLPEVFEQAAKIISKKDRIQFLRDNNSAALRDILRINFDEDIVSLLPEGAPPYKKDDGVYGYSPSSLHKEYKMFKYFFKGGSTINQTKRETMFINLLESVHPDEAEILIKAKDRNLKLKGISKILIKDTFPTLLKGKA